MTRFAAIRYLLPLPLLVAACAEPGDRAGAGGTCPAGETCSDDTPHGLYFLGTSIVGDLDGGPRTTAIGGTQEITVETETSTIGDYNPLTLPFVADDDGALGVKVLTHTGAIVSVQGVAARSNYLRILSASTGELYDRTMIDGAAIADIALTSALFETIPSNTNSVWFIGEQTVGIGLYGDVQGDHGPESQRLVDTSMTITATGSDRREWDTLHFANAQASVINVHVEAGSAAPRDVPLEFVDHADAIQLVDSDGVADTTATVQAGQTGFVCFAASNAGRYIHGATWTFTRDGVTAAPDFGNSCVSIDASAKHTGDTVALTVTAGGKTSTLDVHIVADPNARTATKHHAFRAVEGERALALTK
ncbi:MAG TPA: hypothetical protein VGM90_35595 [Kofleriaceae bacterium]|jgi:hypothetical protein